MDFASDGFAKDMDTTPKAGSGSESDDVDASAQRAQGAIKGPVSGEVIGPDVESDAGRSARDSAAGGAKGRQGAPLMLIPPVTRAAGDPHGTAHFSATDADFGARHASRSAGFAFPPRGWSRYAVPVVLGFCLFGVGVATGDRLFGGAVPATSAAHAIGGAAAKSADSDRLEMQRLNKKMANEIQLLQSRVDALRVAVQSPAPEDLRGVKKDLDGLKASFESSQAQTNASIAQVKARLDRLQHQDARLEKPAGPTTTGSLAKPAVPHGTRVAAASVTSALPRGEARPLGLATETKKRPHFLSNWVVRDVYEGVALVEGPEGAMEVTRGESIPGAGRVEAIERKNGGWIVVTSRGVMGSLGD
ncbi:hypothetical protein [Methylovirgula sp. HY1]|uniref:hypothetical protein n=1 Tax=Methylovirgula sp. HY1 TaxID=2822761 RepID=UPI001C5BE994|nr:hypothetical protein [Methylovirgula sp. HY1]QXX74571.1 hypothetical protein MHY1_01386 [Methylovirgula sp. HY1]